MPSGTQALPPDFYSVLRSVYQNDAERERLRMCGEQVLGIGKNVVLKCAAGFTAQTNIAVDQPRSFTSGRFVVLYCVRNGCLPSRG